MDNIKIKCLNIRGLRNNMKRKSFFASLKKSSYNVICLQETYITNADIDTWEREWGGQLFCAPVSNHSLGQVILIKKHFPYNVTCVNKTDRILSIEIQMDDKVLFAANVYAPTFLCEKEPFPVSSPEPD